MLGFFIGSAVRPGVSYVAVRTFHARCSMNESEERVQIPSLDPHEWATADDRDDAPAHPDDPNIGNPDADPGDDNPRQRPITDNKAGG